MKFNLDFSKFCIIFFVILCTLLFYDIIYSSSPFQTSKTCSQIFGDCNADSTNDSCQPSLCDGTQYCGGGGCSNYPIVKEVYINATNFLPGEGINVTCEFKEYDDNAANDYNFEYVWYYNTTDWINIQNWTVNFSTPVTRVINRTVNFTIDNTEGTHIVRCILSWNESANSNFGKIPDNCANVTFSDFYDNDDVNFTVTNYPSYDSWNLTNTTGALVPYNVSLTRFDSINASAHWF